MWRASHLLLGLTTAIVLLATAAIAHDFERTQVVMRVARDGSFSIDVANDPAWLLLRLEPFAGRAAGLNLTPAERDRRLAELTPIFVDRIVLFVDQHEVRPESAEYVPTLGGFRLCGRFPAGARTLRWFYGIVIDPYPLTIQFADGHSILQTVPGEAWSGAVMLPSTTRRASWPESGALAGGAALLLALRGRASHRARK